MKVDSWNHHRFKSKESGWILLLSMLCSADWCVTGTKSAHAAGVWRGAKFFLIDRENVGLNKMKSFLTS